MTEALTIGRELVRQPEARGLLDKAWAYSDSLYATESSHHLDEDALDRPEVAFFVARRAGRALGCGALVTMGYGTAELKSLFVDPAARGQKIGRHLLAAIEAHARSVSVVVIRLETGIRQPEALGLYGSAGYARIGPFGNYRPDPLSVFMEKTLG